MKELDTVIITLAGLKEDIYQYSFNIDGGFFEKYDFSEISECNIKIDIQLVLSSNMMVFEVEITGDVNVPCDSCGSSFDMAIKGNEKLIVKISEFDNFDDEVWMITSFGGEIDLTHFVYECVMTFIPAKRVHLEGECNKEALENLEKFKVIKESNDPRWDQLKEIV
ncbi:MAG: DUF177 domain-containing protein [Flavobacteriales bacterium]|nr:DUF177 domain-containing protein [Flavobacteriales bacterium]